MHKFLPAILAVFALSVIGITGVITLNPHPAQQTFANYYQHLAYKVLGKTSDNDQAWYVQDILRQANQANNTSVTETAIWNNKPIQAPQDASFPEQIASVLQANVSGGEKWVEIDLSEQKLRAHEGDAVVFETLISSGKNWTPTPTGEFRIWIKVRRQVMKGGSKATGDYYYLPNVNHVMYFHKGYGMHQAYWHNNFGHPMSHGCVNMSTKDAEWLYNWTDPIVPDGKWSLRPTDENPGTRVVIHE